MTTHNGWIRVTRDNPCPICDKPDNCEFSPDGNYVYCGRASEGAIKENSGGQFLHWLGDAQRLPVPAPIVKPTKKLPSRDYSALAIRLFSMGQNGRSELAELLGVEVSSLERLEVGWHQFEQYWSFPERDALGKIIGINARHLNGDKKRLIGGKAGLTYATNWDTGSGCLYLVEGGSDTAALMTMDLSVLGRPSNLGGSEILIEMLREFPSNRKIIVVAERDQKPDGLWPGKRGAISTATKLSEGLSRPIHWTLPPDEAKDARDWLRRMQHILRERLGLLFESGLALDVIAPPPVLGHTPDTRPIFDLTRWRNEMHTARIRSLQTPGIYLDRSTTGAGKSFTDIAAIRHLFGERS